MWNGRNLLFSCSFREIEAARIGKPSQLENLLDFLIEKDGQERRKLLEEFFVEFEELSQIVAKGLFNRGGEAMSNKHRIVRFLGRSWVARWWKTKRLDCRPLVSLTESNISLASASPGITTSRAGP